MSCHLYTSLIGFTYAGASSDSTMLDHFLADFQKVQPKIPEINEISEVAESHLLANLEKLQPELPESNEMSKPAESSSITNNSTTVKGQLQDE